MRRGAAAGGRPGAGGVALGGALAACALAAAVAASACAGRPHRPEPPEPALRLWTSGLAHWIGDRRILPVEIANGSPVTVHVEDPDSRRVRVVVFNGAGPDRMCEKDAELAGPVAQVISLGPGEAREVPVDLGEACARVPPGEYRYEVGYEVPAAGSGPALHLRTAFGHVVVEGGPTWPVERGGFGTGGAVPREREGPRLRTR